MVTNNSHSHTFVWATPPAVDMVTMQLDPPKPDWQQFDLETMQMWHGQDMEAISKLKRNHPSSDVFHSEWFEVSSAYMGLSCDGMHFGLSHDRSMFHHEGMHVVTDVMTQLWLHRVLSSTPYKTPSIC